MCVIDLLMYFYIIEHCNVMFFKPPGRYTIHESNTHMDNLVCSICLIWICLWTVGRETGAPGVNPRRTPGEHSDSTADLAVHWRLHRSARKPDAKPLSDTRGQ